MTILATLSLISQITLEHGLARRVNRQEADLTFRRDDRFSFPLPLDSQNPFQRSFRSLSPRALTFFGRAFLLIPSLSVISLVRRIPPCGSRHSSAGLRQRNSRDLDDTSGRNPSRSLHNTEERRRRGRGRR